MNYSEYVVEKLDMTMAYVNMLAEKIRVIAPDTIIPDIESWIKEQ